MRSTTFPAISIRQPWADLIVRGITDIENRSWPTTFRGNILIQAGQKIERDALRGRILVDLGITSAEDYHPDTMAIIGMVEITDCVTKHRSRFFSGPYGFVLQHAVRFCSAIPYPGQLGIFQVPIDVLKGTPAQQTHGGCFS